MKRGAEFNAPDMGRKFSEKSGPSKPTRSEPVRDPAKIVEAGITTKDTLNWMGREEHKPPSLDYLIGDRRLRNASHGAHRAAKLNELNSRRAAFAAHGTRTKLAFELAGEERKEDHSSKPKSERSSNPERQR